jgi:hypothetical protein
LARLERHLLATCFPEEQQAPEFGRVRDKA